MTRLPPSPVTAGERIAGVANIFLDPGAVFGQEARKPHALLPFIVLSGMMMVAQYLLAEPTTRVAVNSLSGSLPPGGAASVDRMIRTGRWVGVLTTPVTEGLRLLLLGGIVYGGALLGAAERRPGDYHRAVSIAAYASLALGLEQVLGGVTLQAVGLEQIRTLWDLKPLPGLHWLVENPSAHPTAFALLERLNPFTLAFWFLLALGVKRVFRASWPEASAVAAVCVAVGISVAVAATLLVPPSLAP